MLRIRIKHSCLLLLFCCCYLNANEVSAQSSTPQSSQLGLQVSSDYHSIFGLFKKQRSGVFSIHGYYPGSISNYSTNLKQSVELDSPDSFVMIRRTVLNDDIGPPVALSFHQFLAILYNSQMKNYWQESAIRNMVADEKGRRGSGGINLEIPVKIKSKTFQKIFGSGTVGLSVTGDIRIQAGLRREDRSETKTAVTRGSNTNFKMQQSQRFSVTGKIGDKVKVNVDQDSERAFDFDNNVRLVYEGYDDDIVKRFEAGNISLSLPGTRYVTFSGKNSGLFGLKTEMVLGNLNFTAIASQEKGQSQKLSLSGGAVSGSNRVEDYRYTKDQYFFLDEAYRLNYRYFNEDGNHLTSLAPGTNRENGIELDSIEVYTAAPGNDSRYPDKIVEGRATLTGNNIDFDNFVPISGESAQNQFIRLEKSEYVVSNELGYIRLRSPLADTEILAVAYKNKLGETFGDLTFTRDSSGTKKIALKLIRDQNPQPAYKTWGLSWKHVYYMGSQNIQEDGLEVSMLIERSSGPPDPNAKNGKTWLNVFGLDSKDESGTSNPDGKFDIDVNTFIPAYGELHFRDLQPFDPIGYYVLEQYPTTHNDADLPPPIKPLAADELGEVDPLVEEIYTETTESIIRGASKYYLDIKTQNRGSQYSLGFNVIEGSEVVTLDGQVMQKGKDYTIDYFSGQLVLLNERASSPSAQLDVTYERNQLFQLEKKTIMGMRAEYDLGNKSFIGGTFLFLKESTLDRKVRVGRGPMQNMVWDVNTRLSFKPNFLGKLIDALPVVRNQGETILDFEGEIAQILPNPNTLNSSRTGDNKGVAYIDDFESAKKTVNLGILRRNWFPTSEPVGGSHSYRDKAENFIWYNPVNQVPLEQIFPRRDVSVNTAGGTNATHVLKMDIFENPDDRTDSTVKEPGRWAGVMRALSPGFYDQSQTKFIEIMVQGSVGRLHIDLGTISEDVIPNGRLDTEDLREGVNPGNRLLDPGEDTGIDGVAKIDPPRLNFPRRVSDPAGLAGTDSSAAAVPYDFWDINQNGFKNFDEPWSYDDWFYPELSRQYITPATGSIDGTENSQNDTGGRLPDTEDINANGILDPINQYFSYSFSLRADHPDYNRFVVGGNPDPNTPGGPWKLYRIPFSVESADFVVGTPSTNLIQNVRIWVDELDYNLILPDLPKFSRISIAEINLVGSEWKELGLTRNEFDLSTGIEPPDETRDIFAVTQINNHEDEFYDDELDRIGVAGEVDKITKIEAREQSLVLKAINLPAGKAGLAQKSLFQGESYIHYDRIKMFVYGIDERGTHFSAAGDTSYLEYFVRFGANKDNYYEYRASIFPGWDEDQKRNEMDIPLLEFTAIDRALADTVKADSSIGGVYYDRDNDIFVRRLGGATKVIVKGSPSLTNVRILTLGLRNNHPQSQPFTGEVWFNELRLSDIEQERGMAMRARANMRIGTFGTVNAEVEKKDADFHNVAQRFGSGNNSISRSLNTSINAEQVLPQFLGISMPVSFNLRSGSSHPKYFPGLDRRVTNADLKSDSLLTRIESVTEQTGFNVSLRRRVKSKNFFVKNTFDNMSFSLGRSKNSQRSPTIAKSENVNWTGNFDYRLDFGKNNYFKLLSWLPGLPLIDKLKETKFYYTPQNISMKLSGNKTHSEKTNRIQNTNALADTNITKSFIFDRSLRTSMKVFESLSLDISRAYKSQMRDRDKLSDFLAFDFNDISQSQSFSARYSPNIVSWLNNNVSYSSNYRFNNNLQNRETGRSASVNVTRSADFTFKWKTLVNSFLGKGKKGSRSRGRSTPPDRNRGDTGRREDPGGEEKRFSIFQQKTAKGKGFNPLKMVGSFFSSFKDIQFNISQNKDNRQAGLDSLGMPSLGFQFGLKDSTGVNSVESLSGIPFSSSDRRNFSASTGLAVGRAVDIQLRFQHNEQSSFSSTRTGSESNSHLSEFGFDIPFPDWTVRVTGLNKLPLLNKAFKTVTFSHSFAGSKDISWNGDSGNPISENTTSTFRPFMKLDLGFKNGFTGNIQYNKSTAISRNVSFASGAKRTRNSDIAVTANYSKRSGFSLPIWPFNKSKLKNSIDFSFSFTASEVIIENAQGIETIEFVEADKTTRWSFLPKLTYSFSTTVRGGAFIEVGQTESKRVGKTKIQEFGIDVNIAIRGN